MRGGAGSAGPRRPGARAGARPGERLGWPAGRSPRWLPPPHPEPFPCLAASGAAARGPHLPPARHGEARHSPARRPPEERGWPTCFLGRCGQPRSPGSHRCLSLLSSPRGFHAPTQLVASLRFPRALRRAGCTSGRAVRSFILLMAFRWLPIALVFNPEDSFGPLKKKGKQRTWVSLFLLVYRWEQNPPKEAQRSLPLQRKIPLSTQIQLL